MDISSNPWRVYQSDVPGPIGFTRPGDGNVRGPVGVKRVRWFNATDTRIPPGSVAHLKDADDRDVFRAVWPDDDGVANEVCVDVGHVYRGLYLTTLESGQLEIYIE